MQSSDQCLKGILQKHPPENLRPRWWASERRVSHKQTWEQEPPSVWADIFLLLVSSRSPARCFVLVKFYPEIILLTGCLRNASENDIINKVWTAIIISYHSLEKLRSWLYAIGRILNDIFRNYFYCIGWTIFTAKYFRDNFSSSVLLFWTLPSFQNSHGHFTTTMKLFTYFIDEFSVLI